MSQLKILQINKFYPPVTGGIEKVVRQIAEGLAGQTDMSVLACQPKGRGCVERINGVQVYRAASLGTYFSMPISISFLFYLRRLKKEMDVLHFHLPFPLGDVAFWLWRLQRFPGKVVITWHSDIVKQKRLRLLFQYFSHYLLKRADYILVGTIGHIMGSDILSIYKDKCVVIPYGLDRCHEEALNMPILTDPAEPQTSIEIVSEQTSPSRESVNILFVGRLVYYKGCQVLLEAFSQTQGAKLTLVGNGPLKEKLSHQADALGIAERVCFKTQVSDAELIDFYKTCDLLVLPSIAKSEAFGLVQIEAMAYGKPVINTNLPSGVPYVSLHDVTGLTVEINEPEALAEAMQTLIDQPQLRRQYGDNARQRVKDEFRMDIMLEHVLELYRGPRGNQS